MWVQFGDKNVALDITFLVIIIVQMLISSLWRYELVSKYYDRHFDVSIEYHIFLLY